VQRTEVSKNGTAPAHFEALQYLADPHVAAPPAWEGWLHGAEAEQGATSMDGNQAETEAQRRAEFEKRLADETRKSLEAGRERGRQEGRQIEREAQAAANAAAEEKRKRQMADVAEEFANERDRFFHDAEREVVLLALAVAARILRREAQMDPLLLTGAVRVALGQLAATTDVKLLVPSAEVDLWMEAMAMIPNLGVRPRVAAGEGMRLGDCVVESTMGSVDLGIRSQLGEIERGFFDRAGTGRADAVGVAKPPSGATEARQ